MPILIVDDHQLVGSSLALSLCAEGLDARFDPVGSARGVLASAGCTRAGIVILDLDLGRDDEGDRIDGVVLVAPLCAAGWRVLALTDRPRADRIGAALAAGGSGWVPKYAPFPTLLLAIRATINGQTITTVARRQQLIELHHRCERERRQLAAVLDTLTAREREVLALLAAGRRARAVAEHFVVSIATVRTQIRAVLTKLDVDSQLEAVALYSRARDHRPAPGVDTGRASPPRPPAVPVRGADHVGEVDPGQALDRLGQGRRR